MSAVFVIKKAKKREGDWYHPTNGNLIASGDKEIFVFEAVDVDTSKPIAAFIMDRHCVEQLYDNTAKAMNVDPLWIRKCPS
jgi:hypothetical protein